MIRDDDADNDYDDDDDLDAGDDDVAECLRKLELCRAAIVDLRERVAKLEGNGQRNRSTTRVGRAPTGQQIRKEGTIR